jgi:gluconate 2-dehydrogenase gamma chain
MGRKRSRREVLTTTALGFGAYIVAGPACKRSGDDKKKDEPALPQQKPALGLFALTAAQHKTLQAACERILPKDEDPGALELGCADYIDQALGDEDVRAQFGRQILGGLNALDRQAKKKAGKTFPELTAGEQDELLSTWQKSTFRGESGFFEILHTFTLEGAFGHPAQGGNQGGKGFKMVGFTPPEMVHLPGGAHLHKLGQGRK